MLPENRIATHPGEVLQEEFLRPGGITQVALARHIGIPLQRVNEIVRGKRGVTPETAWMLSQSLGTTPEFWMNLQNAHDLTSKRPKRAIERLVLWPVSFLHRFLTATAAWRQAPVTQP